MAFFYDLKRGCGFVIYVLITYICFAFADIIAGFAIIISRQCAYRVTTYWGHRMARLVLFFLEACMGIKTKLVIPPMFKKFLDTHQNNNILVLANHQSYIDIVAIMCLFMPKEIRFIAKKSLSYGVPLVSKVLRIQRHALVNRNDFVQSVKEVELFRKHHYDSNKVFVVFPEGTRSKDGALLPFHSSAVRILLKNQALPMVVVSIYTDPSLRTMFSLLHSSAGTYRAEVVDFIPEITRNSITSALERAKKTITAHHATIRNTQTTL